MAKKKDSDFIDIRALLDSYIRRWPWFVVSVVLCVAAGFLYTKFKKPVYSVHANVLIAQADNNPLGSVGAGSVLGDVFGAKGRVDDEFYVLSSHSVYRDAARTMGLNKMHYVRKGFLNTVPEYDGYPIDVTYDPAISDTLKTSVTFKIKAKADGTAHITVKAKDDKLYNDDFKLPHTFDTPYGQFTVTPTADYPEGKDVTTTVTVRGYNSAAEALAREIDSNIASKRSNAISLTINTPYPKYGEAVLNQVIEQYNERGIREKNLQAHKTYDFITERLTMLLSDLNMAESEIQNYKENNGIIDVKSEAAYQTGKRSALEAQLLAAETENEILRMTLDFVRTPEHAYDLIPTPNGSKDSPVGQYNALILRRMELAANAKPGNIALTQMDKRIDAMRENVVGSVERELETSGVRLRDLRAKHNATIGRLGHIPTQERESLDKERQRQIKQQIYVFLLQRQEETALLLANATPKGIVVDEAYTMAEPLGMGRKMILLMCLLIGLLIPPVIIYLRKLFNDRVETREEVENNTDVPVLGEISTSRSGKVLVVDAAETSSTAELFRLMRSNLMFILTPPHEKVVLVTSANPGEGKSFVAINLAASLALLGKRVLLVGMDIRKPRLADYIGISPRFGLTQYIASNDIQPDNIINPVPGADGLDVIVAGPIPPNPGELLLSPRVDELMSAMRERYDYIILDTAPAGRVSDTFTLDRLCDASIFVCRTGVSSRADLSLADDIYSNKRLHKLSVVVNGTAARRTYGYGEN